MRRVVQALAVLAAATFLSFAIMNLAPGSALRTFIDPRVPPAEILEAERALGLGDPVVVQYLRWLGELSRGNLGYSLRSGNAVGSLILSRLGPTLTLMGTALVVMTLLALLLGLVPGGRDALDGAQRGWVLVLVITVVAGITAALVGRAQHPDLAVATSVATTSPQEVPA